MSKRIPKTLAGFKRIVRFLVGRVVRRGVQAGVFAVEFEGEAVAGLGGVNCVVYDISSKLPATIEWE